eukprot:CAMPEP_0184652912 /NCGR_PEP_ID=MMETSP0308-20130426/10627_1 /TAXON_ID=38269 /ORGANISM="Gloeochaete witrockiana, Strain SAG 46.84" /LENGTH=543 /DNA_ID=CAMNT_0027088073 /DNA_START=320 /DNA_END=1951 /DNA_ORIENTATION=+
MSNYAEPDPIGRPHTDRDACGVRFVGNLSQNPSRELATDAVERLRRHRCRGARRLEENTGEVAGNSMVIPHNLVAQVVDSECKPSCSSPAFLSPSPTFGKFLVLETCAKIILSRAKRRRHKLSSPLQTMYPRLGVVFRRIWSSVLDQVSQNPYALGAVIIATPSTVRIVQAMVFIVVGWLLGLVTTAVLPYLPHIFSILFSRLGPMLETAILSLVNRLQSALSYFVGSPAEESELPEGVNRPRFRFLVAVDGSDTSLCSLEHAVQLCRPGYDRIVCAWVGLIYEYMEDTLPKKAEELPSEVFIKTDALVQLGFTFGGPIDEARRKMKARAKSVLAKCRAVCRKYGVECSLEMLVGEPERQLLDEAAVIDADLLVVGSRGLNPAQRLLLGSVSTSLVQKADCPVMVVKPNSIPPSWPRSRNILVAADGSTQSWRAFNFALRMARPGVDRMIILCVFRGGAGIKLNSVQDFLERCLTACKMAGVSSFCEIRSGSIRGEILEYVNLYDINYAFVGSRPLSTLQRFARESVSEYCVQSLAIPVVVVK